MRNPAHEDCGDPLVDPRFVHALGAHPVTKGARIGARIGACIDAFDPRWLFTGAVLVGTRVRALVGPHAAALAECLGVGRTRRAPHSTRRRRASRSAAPTTRRTSCTPTVRVWSWAEFARATLDVHVPVYPRCASGVDVPPGGTRGKAGGMRTLPDYVTGAVWTSFPSADAPYVQRVLTRGCAPRSRASLVLARTLADRRAVKRAWEVACVRRACALTTTALQATIDARATFVDLAALRAFLLERLAVGLGVSPAVVIAEADATGPSPNVPGRLAYTPIFTCGGPEPGHGIERVHPKAFVNRTFGPAHDATVLIDVGVRVGGYCADITRTFSVGAAFRPAHQALYDLVKRAYTLGAEMVKPGASYAAIGAAVRRGMQHDLQALGYDEYGAGPNGWGDYMPHGLGHMVGLQVHDAPELHDPAYDILRPNYVLTVEPGVYVDDACIRIENTLRVTATGCEVLSCGCPW